MKDRLKKAFFAGVKYGAADGNAPTFEEWLKTLKPPADCDKCSKRAVYFDEHGGAFCKGHCIHNFSDYSQDVPRCIHCGEKND